MSINTVKHNSKKVILLIMDGWGDAKKTSYNAIANADTPNLDKLTREYPNTLLKSDGLSVGLPEGQMGTSEVNHLTMGSGRVIYQDLPRINGAIESGEFFQNPAIINTIENVEKNNSKLHLMGIVSDGGVHSHYNHIFAIFELLDRRNFQQPIFLHVFSDGRDVAPKSVEKYLNLIDKEIAKYPKLEIKIADIQGRVFLDRDRDWARTETAFQLLAQAKGNKVSDWQAAVNMAYNTVDTDEYFGQFVLDDQGTIGNNDGLIIFHYRTDRLFQIVQRILNENFKNFAITTFVEASSSFTGVTVAFPRIKVNDTLAEVLSKSGKKQLHITETEKFAHLTVFFNGERDKEFPGETWKLYESNRFVKPRYDFEPSMRSFEIAKEIINVIAKDEYDFIVANFPNTDMVGHTGNYHAAIIAAQAVDHCVGEIYNAIKDRLNEYALIITADHGNSEIMWDEKNNQPHTQHTNSKIPFIFISDIDCKLDARESMEDIAPTVIDLMDLQKPVVMTGTSLIIKK